MTQRVLLHLRPHQCPQVSQRRQGLQVGIGQAGMVRLRGPCTHKGQLREPRALRGKAAQDLHSGNLNPLNSTYTTVSRATV